MKKFPIILQRDAIQCGISCLQMICLYYGKTFSFEEMEKMCEPTIEGISLLETNKNYLSLKKKYPGLVSYIGIRTISLSYIDTLTINFT